MKTEHTAETFNENVRKYQREQSSHLSNKISQPVYNGNQKEVVSAFSTQNKLANDKSRRGASYLNLSS
tara:strand:+ start:498 stop:701 length:204 start_codon:yes stop_codon:yes gene_type:complete